MIRKLLAFSVALALACASSPLVAQNNARMLTGVNHQVGATYTLVAADATRLTSFSRSTAIAATLPAPSTTGFGAGTLFSVNNVGAGSATITCSGCTINGGVTLVLTTSQSADIYSDGTNYSAALGSGTGGGGGSLPTATAAGQYPNSTGPGTTYTAQSKLVVDARDIGVDCTGASDSSTALNAFTLTQKELDFPYNCQVRLNSTWTISGAGSFLIRGLGERPNQGVGGPQIFGCGTSGTQMIYINRSQYGRIEGLGLYAKGNSCVSTFTVPLTFDNTGAGGLNSHDLEVAHNAISTSPAATAISGFIGVQVPNGAAQNLESVNLHDNWIHCQNSANSIGFDVESTTSDSDEASRNDINNCKFGIANNANIRMLNNLFSGVGNNSVFGSAGAAIDLPFCVSGQIYAAYNQQDSGGPFIAGGCAQGTTLIANGIGVSDIASGVFVIDVGSAAGPWTLIGNYFNVGANTNQYVIGSTLQPALKGPLGSLTEISNWLTPSTLSHTLGWEDLTRPFQNGESRSLSTVGSTITLGPNLSPSELSTISKLWTPSLIGNNIAQQSPFLGLRAWTGAANDDWLSQTSASPTGSSFLFAHNAGPATSLWFNWDGQLNGLNLAQLSTPGPPTGVTPVGTPGGTTYTYALVVYGQSGNSAGGATLSTNTGNATLSSSNYNLIQWSSSGGGANKYCVWRTAGGATQGNIGCVSYVATGANSNNGDVYFFKDTGLAGDSAALPASNTTGQISGVTASFSGQVSAQSFVASGANGGISAAEGDCSAVSPAPGPGVDVLCPNSTAHAWQLNNNNGGYFNVAATVKSGTATMTTAAIGSGACGATVTVAATGAATTDAIAWSYNAAPAANPAQLVVSSWPTANNVNFQYCNPSAGSITPAAATLNWRVGR